jgi:hypothetical protein
MTRHLSQDRQGNVAIVTAFVFTALVASVGYSIDYAGWTRQRMSMQSVADVAALAAANAYSSGNQISAAQAATTRFVTHNPIDAANQPTAGTTLVEGDTAIKVTLSAPGDENFAFVLGMATPTLEVHAVASLPQSGVPCVLALDSGNTNGAIHLDSNARITTPNCTVRTVSTGSQAIQVRSNAKITAKQVCTSGGYKTWSNGTITPTPQVCPQITDPFASVAEPAVGACNFTNKVLDGNGSHTLSPGVYCGGLVGKSNVKITLNPGVYIIKDGIFQLDSNTEASGTGVAFYLKGNAAVIDFNSNVKANFTAPTSGPLAGFIFFEDRNATLNRVHNFDSNSSNLMEGVLYFSRGIYHSDSNVATYGSSNFTIIVARRVDLNSNSNITLNANFGNSSVPIPGGASNTVVATRLIE